MSNIRFEALKTAFEHKSAAVEVPEGKVKDYFAKDVFTREKMKEYISQDVLDQLFDDVDNGRTIHRDIAGVVAIGIRKWAIEHGATHFTHWFQPLTGGTAEKHDNVLPLMAEIREHADALELIVDDELWTLPKYRELMFIR